MGNQASPTVAHDEQHLTMPVQKLEDLSEKTRSDAYDPSRVTLTLARSYKVLRNQASPETAKTEPLLRKGVQGLANLAEQTRSKCFPSRITPARTIKAMRNHSTSRKMTSTLLLKLMLMLAMLFTTGESVKKGKKKSQRQLDREAKRKAKKKHNKNLREAIRNQHKTLEEVQAIRIQKDELLAKLLAKQKQM